MSNLIKELFKDKDFEIEVNISIDKKTILFTVEDLTSLFNKSRTTIQRHIKNICTNWTPTIAYFAQVQLEGERKVTRKIPYYDLELTKIIANKIGSNRGHLLELFLEDYLLKNNLKADDSEKSIIIYNNGNVQIDVSVSPKEETVWLTQNQIALLFETTQPNISMHINSILNEGELDANSVHKKSLYTAPDLKSYLVDFYNLDMILAIGYRVKSSKAIEFRKWATSVLKKFLLKGYSLNDERILISKDSFIQIENDLDNLKDRMDYIEENLYVKPVKERLFFNGEFFDSFSFIYSLIKDAKEEIIIIDPYFYINDLFIFAGIDKEIRKKICVAQGKSPLSNWSLNKFKKQYGNLEVKIDNDFHDRFLIIDRKECYSLGTSLNYVGKKVFAMNKYEDNYIMNAILDKLNIKE